MEKIEKIENLVTIRKIEGESINYIFVDMKNLILTKCDADVYETSVVLEKKISENNLINELFECIEQLANMNDSDTLKIFTMKDISKLGNLLKNGSNYIASNGKLGQANHLLISWDNFRKYNVEKELIDNLENIGVVFSDTIKDIILYKVNSFDQPGLVLIHNNEKYLFKGIGFYPERQFQKITLSETNN